MSGIAGVFRRSGSPVEARTIDTMLRAISHRGPDDSGIWTRGSVGLGNCLLVTTPEARNEKLPATHNRAPFTIAADARIDNRTELCETLDLPKATTDSAIILEAYAKWGEDAPCRLIGDFSFAIWDERERKLFCARDTAGLRSFYYYANRDLFVFGSEIKALRALAEVPAALNETRIGDYLINLYEDRRITFYKDVFRLPAATCLSVTRERMDARTYWKLDPGREIRLGSDAEYTEAFKEKFDEAVRCRIRSAHAIGSALSGGLDSSAIACTARNMAERPVHTFSVIFPSANEEDRRVIDERAYIDKVLETGSFAPHFVRGDRLSPLRDVREIHYHLDEANFAPNLYLHWAMYGAAKENGVRVFLDGLDGDTTVSHGFEYLEELGRTLRWKKLYSESKLLAENLFGGSRARRVIWNYCVKEIAPIWAFQAWRLLRGRFREVRENSALVSPELTQRLDLRRRARKLSPPRNAGGARGYHHKALSFALYAHALEMADKTSAAFGIEARYPFFDRRLIEFCLALPATQKLGAGWNRLIFRRAMEGVLPREIQWRGTKANLSSNFHRKLLDSDSEALDRIASSEITRRYVDAASARRALAEYRASPLGAGGKNSIQLFTAANLVLWLEQNKFGRATHA